MANPITRAISPLAAAVDDVSDVTDTVESIYTPYSPYVQNYAVRDPNMRDAVRLAALGLTPADLAPQPSPFSRVPSSVNKDKLKALEASVLAKLKLLPKDILPVNLNNTGNGTPVPVKETVEQNLGNHLKQSMPITNADKSEEYIKKMYAKQAKLNRELSAFSNAQNDQVPVQGTDTSKNPIGNSVKKKTNQKKELPQNLLPVDLGEYVEDTSSTVDKQPVMTSKQIGDYYAKQGAKKSVDNPKTALSEAQRDYYRYLTGYQRMAPNQAILSMGLDPNKYYY